MELLAAGPWVFAVCCVPHRIVLRRRISEGVAAEYMTHLECCSESGQHYYDSGNYFTADYLGAMQDFCKRSMRSMDGANRLVTIVDVEAWVKQQLKELQHAE